MTDDDKKDFESLAKSKRSGLVMEFVDYLKDNKKWWLTPVLIFFLLFGLLVLFTSTGIGPYLYTLF